MGQMARTQAERDAWAWRRYSLHELRLGLAPGGASPVGVHNLRDAAKKALKNLRTVRLAADHSGADRELVRRRRLLARRRAYKGREEHYLLEILKIRMKKFPAGTERIRAMMEDSERRAAARGRARALIARADPKRSEELPRKAALTPPDLS